MTELIAVLCRRCRVEIPDCAAGALVGCMDCHLYTRATLTHKLNVTAPVEIRVSDEAMGFRVRLWAGGDELFRQVLGDFQSSVPKAARCFNGPGKYWFVHKRAEKKLRAWFDRMRASYESSVVWVDGVEGKPGAAVRGRAA